jgi:hypothetical protein
MGLSFDELRALALDAGFSPSNADTAAAIALAESGGNPQAHNPVPPDDSYGLWQINMLSALGPQRRAQWGLRSNSDLFDPSINASAAFSVFRNSGSFRPWSTYLNGAYRKYLKKSAPFGLTPQARIDAAITGASAIDGDTDTLSWTPIDNAEIASLGVGAIIAAGVSIVAGLYILFARE